MSDVTPPPKCAPKEQGSYHTVETGDTLAAIADTYEVDLKHLAEINHLTEPYRVKIGSRILVPNESAKPSTDEEDQCPPMERSRKNDAGKPFIWPVGGKIISRFSTDTESQFRGIRIRAKKGSPVRAAAAGKVGHVKSIGGLGNLVLIQHANRLVTVYAHLKDIKVKKGEFVNKGTVIGRVGTSGRTDSPCLYFEVRSRSNPKDPLRFLEDRG